MSHQIISLAGWAFLPNIITGWVQGIYYQLTIRVGDPKPTPGSQQYLVHRRRIYAAVVSAYLLFTIFEADWEIQREGSFYQSLRVNLSASEKEIKSRFRRLAARYHPDKLATNSLSNEHNFVQLKLAQDTLLHPVKRFAYERFGPDMLKCERCFTMRDYIAQGLQVIIPYYCGAALIMCIFGFLGYIQHGTYWRWLALVCLCVFELHTISRPHFPLVLSKIINPMLTKFSNHPPYPPFQFLRLLRKTTVTLYIALSQLSPLFTTIVDTHSEKDIITKIDQLEAKARSLDIEASRLLNLELSPYFHDKSCLMMVEERMKTWLVQNTLRMDPMVREAFTNTLNKKRFEKIDEKNGINVKLD